MKKMIAWISILSLCVALAACGKDNTQVQTQGEEQQSSGETQGDGGQNGWSPEMEEIKTAVTAALGENYWPNTAIIPEMLEGTYGLTTDLYDDILAEMPMIGTHVDTLIIVKAKEDKVDEVETILNAYREMLVNDTMQYPMNVGKIQASRIEKFDNYVCFVQLGADTAALSEQGDDAVITHCLEQNELAIEVIRNAVVK